MQNFIKEWIHQGILDFKRFQARSLMKQHLQMIASSLKMEQQQLKRICKIIQDIQSTSCRTGSGLISRPDNILGQLEKYKALQSFRIRRFEGLQQYVKQELTELYGNRLKTLRYLCSAQGFKTYLQNIGEVIR